MRITVRQLERLGACDDQVSLFAMYFGRSAEVTLENCLAAADLGLSLDWAAKHLLSSEALAAYHAAEAMALAAYRAAVATARAAYRAAVAPAWAAYAAAEATALAAYRAAEAMALAAYHAAVAPAFYRAALDEGESGRCSTENSAWCEVVRAKWESD